MDPAERVPRESRTPPARPSWDDAATLARAVERLFDVLVIAAAGNNDELQVQLTEFRDEFHWKLEAIERTAQQRVRR